ncbi:cysteine peptidase family C39 domain-containing protein [Luminiphilus sp.]|nr:cysteine peptidase family C39 domain-containing protein [Luminiphilus sp.]MDB2312748.1 cysteine peptidase family C39 domain-containing protein [Luminiphilus sp.]
MNVPVWIVALVILWVTPLANASNDMRSNHIALVKQTPPFNCGLAVLAMLLSAGGPKPVTLTSLSGLAITLIAPASQEYRDRGFSVSELQRLAAAYGQSLTTRWMTTDTLLNASFPLIAWVQLDDLGHFTVVEGIDRGHVSVVDPTRGYLSVDLDDWQSIWLQGNQGIALEL